MPTFLTLLLSLCGCGPKPPATVPEAPKEPAKVAPSPSTEPSKPEDPFAPFPVASQLQIPIPDHLFAGGFERRGGGTAPVNTEEEDRDFFTDPAFDKKGNSGRLFSMQTSLWNRYEPDLPERSVAFICWKPILPDSDGAMMAQLLPWRDGYSIYEVTTDGKRLLVQFEPAYGTKNPGRPLDVYVWKGDTLGKGRFVPKDNKPFPKAPTASAKGHGSERERGFEALTARQYKDAVEAFAAAIKSNPRDAASYYGLGLAHTAGGQPAGSEGARKAIAAFSKAVALDPKRADAWRERGLRYWMEKQYDKAVADATQVIALKPKEAQGYIERAQWLSESGTPEAKDKAITDVRTATRLAPEEREYWEILARLQYEAGRYEDAVVSAKRALDQDDSRNVARVILACISARQGKTEKALALIQAAHDNGITYDERRDGLREIKKALGAQPNSAALKAIYDALSGPDKLEPAEE
jgi:tetratricopeptide (TPR) repeat protein/predicted small lipoprotein YifL